jgi:hypothetical protein
LKPASSKAVVRIPVKEDKKMVFDTVNDMLMDFTRDGFPERRTKTGEINYATNPCGDKVSGELKESFPNLKFWVTFTPGTDGANHQVTIFRPEFDGWDDGLLDC